MRPMVIAAVSAVATASAADPSFGILVGPERDFLQFQCDAREDGTVDCEFSQVKLKKVGKPGDLDEALARITDEVIAQTNEDLDGEICNTLPMMLEALQLLQTGDEAAAEDFARRLPEFDLEDARNAVQSMDPREFEDISRAMAAMHPICDGATREELESLARVEHEKDSRTCSLFINNWTGRFQQLSHTTWAIDTDGPSGSCGVMRLDRFECNPDYPSVCDFISEKRVLLKDNDANGLLPCSGLDETAYRYAPDSDGVYLDCEIVKF